MVTYLLGCRRCRRAHPLRSSGLTKSHLARDQRNVGNGGTPWGSPDFRRAVHMFRRTVAVLPHDNVAYSGRLFRRNCLHRRHRRHGITIGYFLLTIGLFLSNRRGAMIGDARAVPPSRSGRPSRGLARLLRRRAGRHDRHPQRASRSPSTNGVGHVDSIQALNLSTTGTAPRAASRPRGQRSEKRGASFYQRRPSPTSNAGAISGIGLRSNMRCGSAGKRCRRSSQILGCAASAASPSIAINLRKAIRTVGISMPLRRRTAFADS
jgi:hypothetical protein